MSLLFYRRPDYVARHPGSMHPTEYERCVKKTKKAIPAELSFEMVVSNRAMPPCSLQDFMGYLLYVSHDAENLQFYLWLQDYTKRFFKASKNEQALSPPWNEDTLPQQTGPFADPGPRLPENSIDNTQDGRIDFDFKELPLSSISDKMSFMSGSLGGNAVENANIQTSLKWQSFTIQPFRSEINRIISHYLNPGAPRELNLSHKTRTACLHALQHTTHPSAFSTPASIITQTLRTHSHPNFIRWSTINGNKPRIIFGRALGLINICCGFLIAILLTLSHQSRWWRLFATLAWLLGFSFLLAGSNGICLVLYVTHGRHLRPWEQFTTNNASTSSDLESDSTTLAGSDSYSLSQTSTHAHPKPNTKTRHIALEAFGTANSYGHEIWVRKYRAKMMIRKIFDRTVWVQNESIRIVQDKVAWQAMIWGVIATVPLTVLFLALPRGRVIR